MVVNRFFLLNLFIVNSVFMSYLVLKISSSVLITSENHLSLQNKISALDIFVGILHQIEKDLALVCSGFLPKWLLEFFKCLFPVPIDMIA